MHVLLRYIYFKPKYKTKMLSGLVVEQWLLWQMFKDQTLLQVYILMKKETTGVKKELQKFDTALGGWIEAWLYNIE